MRSEHVNWIEKKVAAEFLWKEISKTWNDSRKAYVLESFHTFVCPNAVSSKLQIRLQKFRFPFLFTFAQWYADRNQGANPAKFFAPLEKCVGHSLKIWAPLRKHFAPPGVPSWLRAWWCVYQGKKCQTPQPTKKFHPTFVWREKIELTGYLVFSHLFPCQITWFRNCWKDLKPTFLASRSFTRLYVQSYIVFVVYCIASRRRNVFFTAVVCNLDRDPGGVANRFWRVANRYRTSKKVMHKLLSVIWLKAIVQVAQSLCFSLLRPMTWNTMQLNLSSNREFHSKGSSLTGYTSTMQCSIVNRELCTKRNPAQHEKCRCLKSDPKKHVSYRGISFFQLERKSLLFERALLK